MRKGFSLIEMLIYVTLLSLLMGVIASTMFSITRSYKEASYSRVLESTGLHVMDRLTREIKNADSVDLVSSTFSSNPSRILLNGTDTTGVAYTTEFFVENSVLKIKENGVLSGQITPDGVDVDSFVLRYIDTDTADGIKIELRLETGTSTDTNVENFYSTASLRNF